MPAAAWIIVLSAAASVSLSLGARQTFGLFLLPLVRFDDEEKLDYLNWDPENKKHLAAQQPGAKTE